MSDHSQRHSLPPSLLAISELVSQPTSAGPPPSLVDMFDIRATSAGGPPSLLEQSESDRDRSVKELEANMSGPRGPAVPTSPEFKLKIADMGRSMRDMTARGRADGTVVEQGGELWKVLNECECPRSILEDLYILEEEGYVIDYEVGLIGTGNFGKVFRGFYGQMAVGLDGTPVEPYAPFAAKVADFSHKTDFATLNCRESFDVEKYIVTNVSHKNICTVRISINMGHMQTFQYMKDPNHSYQSPDRLYLIMDLAEYGDLGKYLQTNRNQINTYTKVNLVRDLFAGMLYLHGQRIAHRDVHPGNALLFMDAEQQIVAKWADFGLGFVDTVKRYPYKREDKTEMSKKYQYDILCLSDVFHEILITAGTPDMTNEKERKLLQDFINMKNSMKKAKMLRQVLKRFSALLEGELEI